jgi:AMMECR1 domain-containing protein
MFTEEQQRTLVEIARRAVARCVNGSEPGDVPTIPGLPEATGAFVTLKKRGALRGCIGTLECRRTLPEEVARVAVSAAREDPRFEPVRPSELADLDV